MTELDLYKFVQDKEMRWVADNQLHLWIDGSDLLEFSSIEGDCIVEDGGFEVFLTHGGIVCIDLTDVCELHDIDPERIFQKDI